MTIEIARALGDIKRQMNDLGQRIDNLYAKKHQENADKIEEITPYKETKTAYIEDTSITFTNVPTGNLTIFCPVDYTVQREDDRIMISFEPLEEVIEITISVL